MDPVTGWTIVKSAAEATKKLYEVAKELKDRDAKQKVGEILDGLQQLKQDASQLEDENRTLKERLEFKSEKYTFRSPFYYAADTAERALCAKCFFKDMAAPMGEPYKGTGGNWRRCLVCDNAVMVERIESPRPAVRRMGGRNSWMG
jgi:hypothetical protein